MKRPREVLQRRSVRFTCTAVVDGRGHPVVVTELDDAGQVRYRGICAHHQAACERMPGRLGRRASERR